VALFPDRPEGELDGEGVRVEGEVESARSFGFPELAALSGQVEVGSLIPGKEGGGVRLSSLLAAVKPRADARYATLASEDGAFAVSVPLAAVAENALLAYREGDAPLSVKKGGPVRFYLIDVAGCGTGEVDACANVKRLGTIRLTREREPDVGHKHG